MPSTFFFIAGTLLLSLNSVRLIGLPITDLLFFVSLFFALIETLSLDSKKLNSWMKNPFFIPAGLILLGGLISTFHSELFTFAVKEIIQTIYVITVFVSLIGVLVRRGKTDVIVTAFIWSGVVSAVIAALNYFGFINIGFRLFGIPYQDWLGRYSGTLGHPNKFGYYLTLTSVLTLTKLMGINIKKRRNMPLGAFWILLLVVQFFGLYLSGSLMAYLGTTLALIAIALSYKLISQRVFKNMLLFLFLMGIFSIFLWLINGNLSFSQPLLSGGSLISKAIDRVSTTTAGLRLAVYEQALNEIINHPLVGVGFDQLATSGIEGNLRLLPDFVHNSLLEIFYAGGLFAFMGYLWIYGFLGWKAISVLHNRQKWGVSPVFLGITAAVLAIILMDQFQPSIYQRETWLTIGLFSGFVGNKNLLSPIKNANFDSRS